MRFSLFSLVACTMMSLPLAGHAAETSIPETLTPGTVACLTVKDATDYQHFSVSQPAFAQDLFDRASCYVVKANSPVIRRNQEAGFKQEQLLTGHRVWVPLAAAAGQTRP